MGSSIHLEKKSLVSMLFERQGQGYIPTHNKRNVNWYHQIINRYSYTDLQNIYSNTHTYRLYIYTYISTDYTYMIWYMYIYMVYNRICDSITAKTSFFISWKCWITGAGNRDIVRVLYFIRPFLYFGLYLFAEDEELLWDERKDPYLV